MESFVYETFYKNQSHPITFPWVGGLKEAGSDSATVKVA